MPGEHGDDGVERMHFQGVFTAHLAETAGRLREMEQRPSGTCEGTVAYRRHPVSSYVAATLRSLSSAC